jgi:replication-associated recombination protein RarA
MSDYADAAWTRFLVIASEDIGLADPNVCVQIRALHETWKLRKKSDDAPLYFVHALLILVRAPKSRIVDNALSCFFFGTPVEFDIPDWALDKHTLRGKGMGRGMKHFFEEGAKLTNCALEDPYEEGAKKRRMAANGESEG